MRPLTISLIGLPGSGKTTLCRALAEWLGYPAFVLGDALRARAAGDSELRDLLARGELAPESVAIDLLRQAAVASAETGLVLDGFPRHVEQVTIGESLFKQWLVLWLEVDLNTATSRLAVRSNCGRCGYHRQTAHEVSCPQCGAESWVKRGEDSTADVLSSRLAASQRMLVDLHERLHTVSVRKLDATRSKERVLEQAQQEVSNLR